MPKEVLIYGQISSYSSQLFIETINEILEKDPKAELTARVNSNGGDVDYAWGCVTKFSEYPNKKTVIVDGKAQSMGLYFLAYADDVKCADVANFLLHRASYPIWIENDPDYFTPDRKALLADANKKLRAALEAKIDVDVFQKITGYTLDQVFSMDSQINVTFNAYQAKKMGLVNSIVSITPAKKAEIEAKMISIVAKTNDISIAATADPEKPLIRKTMTLAELKAENPALYQEVLEIGAKEGAVKEKERIEVWTHFMEVDPKAVKEGIASGKPMTQLEMIELAEKKSSKKALETIKSENPGELPTGDPAPAKSAKEKELEDFKNNVTKNSLHLGSATKK